jgi:predicted phage terminase large subunit-like protein
LIERWTKAHTARTARILDAMRREARPFRNSSPRAAAARRALPFDAWIHTYFPHYAWCNSSPMHLIADEMVEEKGILTAEFWFRGAGKTTRALLRRVRRILEGRAHFIIVGGQTEENAAEKLDLIKLELVNNPRLRQDYGERIGPRGGSDTDTDWIACETRLLARGTGQSCRGLLHGPHRPDDFLGDDLEDDFLARNPQREKHLWQWLFGNVFPALETGQPPSPPRHDEQGEPGSVSASNEGGAWCEILLNNYGTRHGLKARFQEAAAQRDPAGRPICRYIEYLAEDERGESAWPERFPTAALRRMAAIMGRSLYGREMLGKSYSEDEVFRPDWVRDFRAADFDRSTAEVRAAVDPSATAKETSDYKALVVLARPRGGRELYCLHAWLRRASPNELIAEILRVYDAFSPGRIGCEANGFQAFLWPLLEANEEIRGRVDRVGLFPITHAASKEDRILSLQPDFERGLCYFDEGEGDQRLLLDQFLDFGKPGVHDDGPDAFEMARRLFSSARRGGKSPTLNLRIGQREDFARAFAGAGAPDRDELDKY